MTAPPIQLSSSMARGKSVPGRPSLTVGRPTWFQKGGTGVPPRPEMLGRRPGLSGPWMLWNNGRKVLHTLLLLDLWEACIFDHNNPLKLQYNAAKEAEADAGVGGKNSRSGQADSS